MRNEEAPQTEPNKKDFMVAAIVFVAAAFAVWLLWANRFFLSLDEGIYLAGAERILQGQAPYRDFFVLTGPGSFWIEAGIMGLLGPTLRHARLALVFDLGLLTGIIYWLASRLSGRNVALLTCAFFFTFETRPLFRLYANHRWDSSAFGLLAVVLVFAGTERPRFLLFLGAGMAAAVAAWITPSLLAVLALLGLWLFLIKELRSQWIPYALGAAAVSLAAASVLFFQGALMPMFRDLLWTSTHYPQANRVPYGYGAIPPRGLGALFSGAGIAAVLARATGLISVLLPVVLPLAVYVVWVIRRLRQRVMDRRDKLATLLIIASFGLVISTYPRWSADQLLFITPIFYVLAGYLLERMLHSRLARTVVSAFLIALAASSLSYSVLSITSEPVIETRIGKVRAAPADRSIIKLASSRVSPGDTVFVYPYLPIIYFLTGARNPTRYSFLQPGMMERPAYDQVLEELQAHPPQWVFYFALPLATYRGIWPAADPGALNLTPVDHFILSNYHPVGILRNPATQFFLLERGAH